MSGMMMFTLAGNKLTFIAKAFEAGSDNTYRVKIKATVDVTVIFTTFHLETEKTITVTVTRFHITTAADFSTPENESKVIELTINENRLGGAVSNQGFEKLTGADADKFTLAGNKLTSRL
jgi:hypothetical protein